MTPAELTKLIEEAAKWIFANDRGFTPTEHHAQDLQYGRELKLITAGIVSGLSLGRREAVEALRNDGVDNLGLLSDMMPEDWADWLENKWKEEKK